MIYPRLNVVLTSQMGLGRTVVLVTEGALCGTSLVGVVWSGQFFFQPHGVFPLSSLPFSIQESTGLTVMWVFFFGLLVCWFFSAARVGLMHIGVFILLLLSGERNFGVRLNKPYSVRVPMDIPVFTGTHADLLIIVSTAPAVLFCPS